MRIAAALATFVTGCALAGVLAYWGWQAFGPAAIHVPFAAPVNPAATIIAANFFGGAPVPSASAAPEPSLLSGDARLLGIVAESEQRGYALFKLPSGPKLVEQGQEIAPGARLTAIDAESITVRDGAGERRLLLRPAPPATAPRSAPRAGDAGNAVLASGARSGASTASARPRGSAACAPPAGFPGTVVRLNTELLGGLDADAGQWRALLAPTGGGLVVQSDSGFAAMLGLKAGDRIAQANGIALTAPDDVASAILRPLVANQGVRLSGSRGNASHELWLANVACAG
jgi:hypothetical protein